MGCLLGSCTVLTEPVGASMGFPSRPGTFPWLLTALLADDSVWQDSRINNLNMKTIPSNYLMNCNTVDKVVNAHLFQFFLLD